MDLNCKEEMLAVPSRGLCTAIKKLQDTKAFKSEQSKLALSTFHSSVKLRFEKINSIACKDLNDGEKISIDNHTLNNKSSTTLSHYIENLDLMNVNKHILLDLEALIAATPTEFTEKISNIILTWHKTFITTWDNKLESVLLQQINTTHKEKCQQQFGIYNFTDTPTQIMTSTS